MIGERANLGVSDQGVIEIKNTVRNELDFFFFNTLSACHETLLTYMENILDWTQGGRRHP